MARRTVQWGVLSLFILIVSVLSRKGDMGAMSSKSKLLNKTISKSTNSTKSKKSRKNLY